MTQTALAELYARQAPGARRLAYLLTGDTQLAEDIVQDCFVKLAGRLRRVEDPESYLRRMVVNASHSHHRRLRVRRERARDEALVVGADSDASPDGADGRADRARLRDALADLPARQRSAVVLRHWLDLSEQQCADELGCSVGTVKSLASRGRAALRLSLEHA
jgi:RNA polymerase sigma-70 factor (sigma-E family)